MEIQRIIKLLIDGKIGVIPTDTIYGIVGSALNLSTVERIYLLRKRNLDKPFIILIGSIDDLEKFEVHLTEKQKDFLTNHWPNPLSVVLPVKVEKFEYLHRGTNSLAFRMPKDHNLLSIINSVSPLVAPSANIESEKPSETIDETKKYFGDEVDFYLDGGTIKSEASTLISLNEDGTFIVLRQGSFRV